MRIQSHAFQTDGYIPKKHTGFGEDVSPDIIIEDLPQEAVSLAVIMVDLDVPMRKEFCHWVIWNIPAASCIPAELPHGAIIEKPIPAVQGIAWGNHCYRGPKQPPFMKKPHRYRFSVFALDAMLSISFDSGEKQLRAAIKGHMIAMAEITGIYDKRRIGDII